MLVAKITRDYLLTESNASRVGLEWKDTQFPEVRNWPSDKVYFRLYDDDRILYYEGWLLNDEECEVQLALLNWGERDAGCTMIDVKIDDKWIQEIG